MKINEYLTESAKTESSEFHAHEVDPLLLKLELLSAIEAGNGLDRMKKAVFYGRVTPLIEISPGDRPLKATKEDLQLLHFAMGMVTESAEILEAVYDYIFNGKELDVVNIREEIGDLAWYAAIFFRQTESDLEYILETNINKLRARYGEKFSSEKALNRDLDTEREILERIS